MDFFDVIERRHSCRAFAARDVEQAKLNRILAALRLAPSAGDLQAFTIVLVREREMRSRLAEAAHGQDFIATAPIVLAFLADEHRSEAKYHSRGSALFCIQDATIAAAYAQLAATAQELASCWVGDFDEDRVAAILGVPSRLRPVVLIPIGYAVETPKQRPSRRPLSELVRHEQL